MNSVRADQVVAVDDLAFVARAERRGQLRGGAARAARAARPRRS